MKSSRMNKEVSFSQNNTCHANEFSKIMLFKCSRVLDNT